MLKLKNIINEIITEIGTIPKPPSNARFTVWKHSGIVNFSINNLNYIIDIRVIIQQDNKIAISVDFSTAEHEYELTNAKNPFLIIGYIMASVEEWLIHYSKQYCDQNCELIYLKFDPKSENDENLDADMLNKRGRIYKLYITKFSEKYNSTAQFSNVGGIVAKFNPPINIKQ